MPQTEMLATPGTPIRRGRTVHRAITDCSIGVSSVEDSPIISTRLDEDSGWSRVGRFGHVGQGMGLGQPLLDQLPGLIDVGAGLEDQDDRGQARHRLRPDDLDALHAVEQVGLEGDRDQLLDLLGRQPERLGLDLGVRGRELRKHIHRCLRSETTPSPNSPTATPSTRRRKCNTPRKSAPTRSTSPTCRKFGKQGVRADSLQLLRENCEFLRFEHDEKLCAVQMRRTSRGNSPCCPGTTAVAQADAAGGSFLLVVSPVTKLSERLRFDGNVAAVVNVPFIDHEQWPPAAWPCDGSQTPPQSWPLPSAGSVEEPQFEFHRLVIQDGQTVVITSVAVE